MAPCEFHGVYTRTVSMDPNLFKRAVLALCSLVVVLAAILVFLANAIPVRIPAPPGDLPSKDEDPVPVEIAADVVRIPHPEKPLPKRARTFVSNQVPVSAPGHWPQWRGPNRDNLSLETGLLKSWPEG